MKRHKTENTIEKLLYATLLITPFCLGGFHLASSAVLSTALLIALFVNAWKQNDLLWYKNDSILAVSALLFGLAASAFWAVDRGMATLGFLQFFPILPFALLVMHMPAKEKDRVLESIPMSGAIMTVLSFLLRYVPTFHGFFTVQGRLAGFFQYPNTFAIFLLCGLIVCFWSDRSLHLRILCACFLLFGILVSGSRTVFILSVVAIVAFCVLRKDKTSLIFAGSLLALGILIVVIYAVEIGDVRSVGRFLTTSLSESTLLGRILYDKDALPVILRHPFGLGYLGYYFTQHSFQTGVYSVMFVHNELLQMLLDVGWIPSLVFVCAVVENIFSKDNTPCQRMLLTVLGIHSLLDFDFQFIAVLFLFLFCMDFQKGRAKSIRIRKSICALAGIPLSLILLYFGASQGLQLFGMHHTALRLYPYLTTAQIGAMSECTDLGDANDYAQQIIARNTFVAEAYRVRAGYAYSQGDIRQFIEDGYTALERDPYNTDGYRDYGDKLLTVIHKGKSIHDQQLVQISEQALQKMQMLLEKTRQRTSALAWRINDQPDFSLSKELEEYIKLLQGE